MFSCLLLTVLFAIISTISSKILKLRMRLVLFLDIICSHEFTGWYPFLYFCCVCMPKQNHREQNYCVQQIIMQVLRTRRIITLHVVTWVTDGGMLYQIVENELYTDSKNVKYSFLFSTLTALGTSILAFYCNVCSILAQ